MKHSEVCKLNELISYQKGGIVSKTIINEDEGSVTIFAFDKGQNLSEHTAPFDALLQVFDGKAEILISDKKYLVNNGEMIKMPANIPHAVNAIEQFKMMLIMVKK